MVTSVADVVLVYPTTGLDIKNLSVWLPLSLLNLASTLVPDYEVAIIDQRLGADWQERLRAAITDRTLCIGISSMTGTQIKGGLAAAAIARAARPEVPLVWGGVHPTLVPEITLRHPLVDIVVLGEGELTFRRLVEALERKEEWRGIPNLGFLRDGEPVTNGNGIRGHDFLDPATLPPLPYHLLDIEPYISGPLIFGRKLRALPYISSSGCPYNCAFCCQPVLSHGRWRKQPAEMVLERTLSLKEKYRLDAIEFHDEEFFVDHKRGERIAGLIAGQYEWYVQTRMDDLLKLDLGRLESAGLRVVHPGIETGSPRILQMIRKDETVETFLEANRRLAATGITATYNFMMGYPTETEEDLTATVDLALRLLDDNPRCYIAGFYVYVPYPGADLFRAALAEGFNAPESLEGWAAFNRQHLASPWIQDRKAMLEMLMFTSKFIDGKRINKSFGRVPLVSTAVSLLSHHYRRRWRRHDFAKTADIGLLAAAARGFFGW